MKPRARKKVLLVDDSRLVRERLAALLGEIPGVEIVGETERAAQAIQAIDLLKPNVVILDISMPGGSGVLVLKALQKSHPAPLRIVLTNLSDDLCRKKCMNMGAEYFFDKSTEFEAVKYLLERMPEPAGTVAVRIQ